MLGGLKGFGKCKCTPVNANVTDVIWSVIVESTLDTNNIINSSHNYYMHWSKKNEWALFTVTIINS